MIYVFGTFELDISRFELRDGATPLDVEPQVFSIIQLLVENRHRMVSKSELMDVVWGGRIVSESAVSSRIRSARMVLGDSGKAQSIIRTVHGQGLRFVAEVRVVDHASSGSDAESRCSDQFVPEDPRQEPENSTNAGGPGLSLPRRPAIVIMPFRNLNEDGENDYIADGIGLGIQTLMVQLSGLFLINAAADQDYRNGTKTASEVARDLPVRFTLEGAAQRVGRRVRVSVQLTDLQDNTVVWAERYDRDLENVFALQDDITREVVSSLNIELFGRDFERTVTRDLSGDGAWEYFLRGVSHIYKFSKTDNERARQMFEKLYSLKPNKVHGPAYIALTYWIDVTRGWSDAPTESLGQAGEWATKAMQYRENDGLGYIIMSYIRLQQGQHDEALRLCEKAIEYRANCPATLGQIATVKLYCGDAQGAVKSARDALSVRIMQPPLLVNLLATAYRDCGEIGLSISTAEEAVRLDPLLSDHLATLCSSHVIAGNNAEAHHLAEKILSIDPHFRISDFAAKHPYKDPSRRVALEESLRCAELPE